jgi:four helix bundle protein
MGLYNDLQVFIKAYNLAMQVFHLTKSFPSSEKFGLTSQIRRSSRSVCSNIAEGYRKRDYPAHFKSKLTDADMENTETEVWIDFSESCKYINLEVKEDLKKQALEIGRLLHYMMKNIQKFQ